jgi:hypothetical protein
MSCTYPTGCCTAVLSCMPYTIVWCTRPAPGRAFSPGLARHPQASSRSPALLVVGPGGFQKVPPIRVHSPALTAGQTLG